MELAEAGSPPERCKAPPTRSARGPVVAIASLMAVCLVGGAIFLLSGWRMSLRHSPSDEALDAAARGRRLLRAGRPDLAFDAVNGVRDESPAAGEAMAVAGQALIGMGQYRVARMALERALKLKPDQFEVAVTLGELNLDLGNVERGVEALRAAVRLRPREFRVWRLLGRALGDMNVSTDAAQAYREVLRLKPDDRESLIESLKYLIESGQSDSIDPWIERALGKYPDDPALLCLVSRRAFEATRVEEAQELAERALLRAPDDADASRERARCLIARSRCREALAPAERAAAATPDDLGTLQLLFMVESRLGLSGRAAETRARLVRAQALSKRMIEFNEQLRDRPDDPELRWRMGKVALEAGSILPAYRCFQAALGLDPDYPPARESLAALKAAHPELARESGPRAGPSELRSLFPASSPWQPPSGQPVARP